MNRGKTKMTQQDKLLKPYCNALSREMIDNNWGFEQAKCDIIAYSVVHAIYDYDDEEGLKVLRQGVESEFAFADFDDLDNIEILLEAENHLFRRGIDSPKSMLEQDFDEPETPLQMAEFLYKGIYQSNE